MKKNLALLAALLLGLSPLLAQSISFGLGDAELEASLNSLNASASLDLPGFYAEVNLQWGVPVAQLQTAVAGGLKPAEAFLAAGLAKISGKSLDVVVASYKKNKAAGWGALAKSLGIKPGSKEFKALKDKSSASAAKRKKK